MIVKVTHVGTMNHEHQITWPKDWPIPRVGDNVGIPELPEVQEVRLVEWCPGGGVDAVWPGAPYVYIVVGPGRP